MDKAHSNRTFCDPRQKERMGTRSSSGTNGVTEAEGGDRCRVRLCAKNKIRGLKFSSRADDILATHSASPCEPNIPRQRSAWKDCYPWAESWLVQGRVGVCFSTVLQGGTGGCPPKRRVCCKVQTEPEAMSKRQHPALRKLLSKLVLASEGPFDPDLIETDSVVCEFANTLTPKFVCPRQ